MTKGPDAKISEIVLPFHFGCISLVSKKVATPNLFAKHELTFPRQYTMERPLKKYIFAKWVIL